MRLCPSVNELWWCLSREPRRYDAHARMHLMSSTRTGQDIERERRKEKENPAVDRRMYIPESREHGVHRRAIHVIHVVDFHQVR